MTAPPCRDNPWTCPICRSRPCQCTDAVTFDANPDWVDDVVIEQVMSGRPPARGLTDAEKTIAARRLAGRGESVNAICDRVGARATVVRKILAGVPA